MTITSFHAKHLTFFKDLQWISKQNVIFKFQFLLIFFPAYRHSIHFDKQILILLGLNPFSKMFSKNPFRPHFSWREWWQWNGGYVGKGFNCRPSLDLYFLYNTHASKGIYAIILWNSYSFTRINVTIPVIWSQWFLLIFYCSFPPLQLSSHVMIPLGVFLQVFCR